VADITVQLDEQALSLDQLALTLPGAGHIQYAETQVLELTPYAPDVVISFPGLSRAPSRNFSDEPSDDAVIVGAVDSGYPVLNKLFTFDGRTFTPELRSVSNADKLTVMDFYEVFKDKEFPWYNAQDTLTYMVCFMRPPRCRMDGRIDLWRIQLELKQTSSETY